MVVILTSCKSYIQVYETNSNLSEDEENFYIYENDTLKITYSFWMEKGVMAFTIYNKLDKPIYIDWKKSSYIDNSVKLNYWEEEERNKTVSSHRGYYYSGPLLRAGISPSFGITSSVSTTIKVERVTFIPPQSNYYRSEFRIMPYGYYKKISKENVEYHTSIKNSDKTTKVYVINFVKNNSPLIFRNFLTFSLSENFNNEFYVDNEFYVTKISEMSEKQFGGYKLNETGKWYVRDDTGNKVYESNYEKPTSFFIKVPK